MRIDYNVGLDIGTTSVGWAVVNSNTNEVVKKGKKALWGVRLFDEAESAEVRRVHRGNRRRFDRRRKRIRLLRKLFHEEIMKVDPYFFQKMEESFFRGDDKINKTIILNDEEKKQIKHYYHKYPTIYHVRKKLLDSDEKQDIRLIYLALHHMIKYRGNFLNDGEIMDVNHFNIQDKLKQIFDGFSLLCPELEIEEDSLLSLSYQSLESALLQDSKIDQKKCMENELKHFAFKKGFISEFVKAMQGNLFSISKLFCLELEKDVKISFKGSMYEDNYNLLEEVLDSRIEVIEVIKELYNMIFLKKLFDGENTRLSDLMVHRYEIHRSDLKFLKNILKYDRDQYNKIFRSVDGSSKKKKYVCYYDQYIHNNIDYDDFRKEVNKALEHTLGLITDETLLNEYREKYKQRIEYGSFMPRITEKDNGKFPYQLNLEEMKVIIQKQGWYYPFLLAIGENGKNKLESLLTFRIPYYVGPLNDTTSSNSIKNQNAWIVKNNHMNITPYNFEKVVNLEESAENFITRMIAKCTYLLDKPVIPANSVLYSEYKVRNELKQIRVNQCKLPVEVQEKIYQNLFLKKDHCPTSRELEKYLRSIPDYAMFDQFDITGFSAYQKFANSMKSYVDFFGENGIFKDTNYSISDAENIIRYITLFEDKKVLESKIRKMYPGFTDEMVRKILTKKYTGWSNLSYELLTTKYYQDPETMEFFSIIDLLRIKDQNFMQIIHDDKYKFQNMIQEFNQVEMNYKIDYQVVDDLATSPKNKRGIYQSLLVLDEIVKYMGYEPKRVIIEMAREEDKKVRKDSKKEYLQKIYQACSNEIDQYRKLKSQLDVIDNENFNNQKLFLYFIQEGKSLYSGKPIDIEHLDECEIDHIIPRTLIKDNSIDNKALVYRDENQRKSANFVLPSEYRSEVMVNWWRHLNKIGLLSSKKLHNLCRKEYSSEDIEGFINRQLVETRQITKHVANIIKNYYKKTDVVYLKATLSHAYREKFKLYKFRDLNDYHHAHDAYLAALLGEYKQSYLKVVDFNRLKEINYELLSAGKYDHLKYGYVINSIDSEFIQANEETGEILFDANEFHHLVEKTLYRNDILISRKTEIKTGEFYNQTKNKKGMSGVDLKEHLPSKWYGSYTSLNPSYITVVKYRKKNKEYQRMVGIPIYIDVKSVKKQDLKKEYVCSLLGIDDSDTLEFVVEKIPFHSLIQFDGQICRLVGASDRIEVCNAVQFHIDSKHMKLWRETFNYLLNKKGKVDTVIYSRQLEEIIHYIVQKIIKNYKLYHNLLDTLVIAFSLDDMSVLTVDEKEKIIIEMLHLLKCNSRCANLKFLEVNGKSLSDRFGRKSQIPVSHARVYHQSVTGLKEYYYEF